MSASKTNRKARQWVRRATPKKRAVHSAERGPRRSRQPSGLPRASVSVQAASLADAQQSLGLITSQSGLDLTAKVKDLLRLAKEQGYLTYDDLDEALPDHLITPADLDQVLVKLRNLDIDIIEAAEVDRSQPFEAGEEEEERARYDILDDPVRMYLRQMGKVPLLT